VLLGKWVIRFWRISCTVILCVCGWVAVAGAKVRGVQLMVLVAFDGDQILDAALIEKRFMHEIVT
jgi:hypothetical protein